MSFPSDNEPRCPYCGKVLSRDESSEQYECLSCSFQRMERGQTFDIPISSDGTANYAQNEKQQEYEELIRIRDFQLSLQKSSPNLIVTKILIALNVLVYIYVSIKGNSFNNPSSLLLLEMGANSGEKVFIGEWWRLFSSMFLHGGLTHIAFNMYALWVIGNIVEKLFGGFGYLVIYIAAGVLGNMLSLYNHSPYSVGVGASGAVFGIFGALISYAYFKKMPKPIASGVLKNAGLMILINGAIGFSIPQIDNSAHIGGCIGGLIVAFFIGQDISSVNKQKRSMVSVFVALSCGLVVFFSWGFIANKNSTNKNSALQKIEEGQKEIDATIKRFNDLENSKESSVQLLLAEFGKNIISKEVALETLEKDYIKFFRKESKQLIKVLDKDFVRPAWKKYTKKYTGMYDEYWLLIKKAIEASDAEYINQAKILKSKINAMRPEDFK